MGCGGSKEEPKVSHKPLYASGEPEKAAKEIGVTLGADQEGLFRSNAWSVIEGNTVECTTFEVLEGTCYNNIVEAMTKVDKPTFHFGRYEYKEEILGQVYQYVNVGHVDRDRRIMSWHPEQGTEKMYCLCTFSSSTVASGSQQAKVGDEVTWEVKGFTAGSKIGHFRVTVRVKDASREFPDGK